MAFARFMASIWGRAVRVIAGIGVIGLGLGMSGVAGIIIVLVGLLLALTGILNVCGLAPLFGAPFRGKDLPAEK